MDDPKLFLRRTLNRVLRFALRMRSRPYRPEAGRVALAISPHPDDAHLGCGGVLARKRRLGCSVCLLHLTDGSASHPGHPLHSPPEVAALRRAEAKAAAGITGIEPELVLFLDAPDGTLDRLGAGAAEDLAGRVAEVIRRLAPEEIFLPCRRDASAEHEAAFRIVAEALRTGNTRPRLLEFPIWSWWSPKALLRLLFSSRRILRATFAGCEEAKRRALEQYRSQFEPTPPWSDPVIPRGFPSFFRSGEEFFLESEPLSSP